MTRPTRRPDCRLAAALLSCILASSNGARADTIGDVNINPVRLTLAADRRSASIELTNLLAEPQLFQVTAQAWSQTQARDELGPTDDLLAVPPIFTIAPQSTQTIRIALQREADPGRELTYRLFITQVPTQHSGGNLDVSLRLSLPVFVAPRSESRRLDWSAARTSDRRLLVNAANLGNVHGIIARLTIFADAQHHVRLYDRAVSKYVLAGQTATFNVTLDKTFAGNQVYIQTRSLEGELAAVVPVRGSR